MRCFDVVNQSDISDFLHGFALRSGDNELCRSWFTSSHVRRYFMRPEFTTVPGEGRLRAEIEEKAPVSVRESLHRKLDAGMELRLFDPSKVEEFATSLSLIADWLRHLPETDADLIPKLSRIHVHSAIMMAQRWRDSLIRRGDPGGKGRSETVLTGDGWSWVRPLDDLAFRAEGKAMRNCLVDGWKPLSAGSEIYSLRDANGRSHLNVEIRRTTASQIRGRANSAPTLRHLAPLLALFRHFGVDQAEEADVLGLFAGGQGWLMPLRDGEEIVLGGVRCWAMGDLVCVPTAGSGVDVAMVIRGVVPDWWRLPMRRKNDLRAWITRSVVWLGPQADATRRDLAKVATAVGVRGCRNADLVGLYRSKAGLWGSFHEIAEPVRFGDIEAKAAGMRVEIYRSTGPLLMRIHGRSDDWWSSADDHRFGLLRISMFDRVFGNDETLEVPDLTPLDRRRLVDVLNRFRVSTPDIGGWGKVLDQDGICSVHGVGIWIDCAASDAKRIPSAARPGEHWVLVEDTLMLRSETGGVSEKLCLFHRSADGVLLRVDKDVPHEVVLEMVDAMNAMGIAPGPYSFIPDREIGFAWIDGGWACISVAGHELTTVLRRFGRGRYRDPVAAQIALAHLPLSTADGRREAARYAVAYLSVRDPVILTEDEDRFRQGIVLASVAYEQLTSKDPSAVSLRWVVSLAAPLTVLTLAVHLFEELSATERRVVVRWLNALYRHILPARIDRVGMVEVSRRNGQFAEFIAGTARHTFGSLSTRMRDRVASFCFGPALVLPGDPVDHRIDTSFCRIVTQHGSPFARRRVAISASWTLSVVTRRLPPASPDIALSWIEAAAFVLEEARNGTSDLDVDAARSAIRLARLSAAVPGDSVIWDDVRSMLKSVFPDEIVRERA
jgi:hypothetical protein